jgi:hypothetical protein
MQSVYELKEQPVTDTPLLVFDCLLVDGRAESWCSHGIQVGDKTYTARVLDHSAFDIQTASDQGVDGSPRISILLANADSYFSEIERSCGWKGAKLTAGFLFYDLRNRTPLSEISTIFQGICNPPEEIRESTFRLTAVNRMNLQRLYLPPVRIQRRCPWQFPATSTQRTEAVDGGPAGKYSRYYRCGYSADVPGGCGTLQSGQPFTSCGYTRQDCQERGMLTRFGGIEFIPPVIAVRAYGKDWQPSAVSINQTRYNDFVPMVYGTAWLNPPVVFARNDGNLTRMQVLLGIGEMTSILKVLVNDVEIPLGVSGTNMTGTGWYNLPTLGGRDGCFDPNYPDDHTDPYGSIAYLAVVVPTRLNNGTSLPSVKVLAQGLKVPTYAADGTLLGEQFSDNPSWILLDILRRSGWQASEIDNSSFASVAAYCDERIQATDLYGNSTDIPRFACNLLLQSRRSGGDVVRGIRNSARLYLTYGPGGVLQLRTENSAALQQPTKLPCSNSDEPWNGGWPSYEFGDGSNGFSGILRRPNGEPSLMLWSRNTADTPNRFTVEFQDALNAYQQDSYSLVNADDVALCGQEISASLAVLGLPHFDQAARILKFQLDKSVQGNTYIQFQTSVKALGIRPGDLITVTYLKEGFNRQPFRVLKISPSLNYRTCTLTAQLHDDAWYSDTNGQVLSTRAVGNQAGLGIGIPKPLLGTELDSEGDIQFGIEEMSVIASDGTEETSVKVSFLAPPVTVSAGPGIPLLGFVTTVTAGGTLTGDQILYYAVSGVDSTGNEGLLSFLVRALIVQDGGSVTLSGLSFTSGTATFNVYRGSTPTQLFRIASDQPLLDQFTDTGFPKQLLATADSNYDHANFYWRLEVQPETKVTIHSPTTVGNGTLAMSTSYVGLVVRINRGKGSGQERTVLTSDKTTVTIDRAWDLEPDASSFFTVAETGWHFGVQTKTSPVQFGIPNRAGEIVQITGRAANVNNIESEPQLSTLTRWQIGGAGFTDVDVPTAPFFGIAAAQRAGSVELSGISFPDLDNTRTISSCTLTLHYWDELQGTSPLVLARAASIGDSTIQLSAPGPGQPTAVIQIEGELMRVDQVTNGGLQYQVTRAWNDSQAAAHAATLPVWHLSDTTVIAPFPSEFFGSPYSGTWSYILSLPDSRVASAELFVTNQRGNSPIRSVCLTGVTTDNGLRTHSGGQYSIQVQGYLAIDQNAAPPIVVDQAHAIRDIFAVVGKAPDSQVVLQLNVDGAALCQLVIAAGGFVSNTIEGITLPPLAAKAQLTLHILAVGITNPGADLTVLVRL